MSGVKSGMYSHRTGGKKKSSPPKIKGIEFQRAENGGVSATHHYDNSGDGGYTPSSLGASFGPGQGKEVLKHMSEHLGLKAEAAKAEPAEETEEA